MDRHNQVRQSELALEKKWVTHNPWFRLATTLVGINVTDTWQLMCHHRLFPLAVSQRFQESEHRNVPIKTMAGNLAAQLFRKADMMEEEEAAAAKSHMNKKRRTEDDVLTDEENDDKCDYEPMDSDNEKGLTFTTIAGKEIEGCRHVITYTDGNGCNHALCKFPVVQTGKNKKKRSRVQSCYTCGKETTYFCYECQKGFCYCLSDKGHGRKCFTNHVPSRTSARLST